MPLARRIAVLVAMLAVIGLFVWAGIFNYRARRARMEQARQTQATLIKDGETSPETAPNEEGTELRGKAAPAFTLTSTDGKKVSLAELKGKPVVVNFWATWCAPCKLEMPWFQEFSQKYKSDGLIVLGLSQDDLETVPKEQIVATARKLGVSYQILLPDEKVAKLYGGVDYLPETFYVGKDGTVLAETSGAPSKDQMEANIRKVIGVGGM